MEWLTVPDAADLLGISVTGVRTLINDGKLIATREGEGRPLVIPADLIQEGAPVKHLQGVITQLRDARFSDTEILDWLWRADDSLPGTPIEALRENRGTEVKRRAQVEL